MACSPRSSNKRSNARDPTSGSNRSPATLAAQHSKSAIVSSDASSSRNQLTELGPCSADRREHTWHVHVRAYRSRSSGCAHCPHGPTLDPKQRSNSVCASSPCSSERNHAHVHVRISTTHANSLQEAGNELFVRRRLVVAGEATKHSSQVLSIGTVEKRSCRHMLDGPFALSNCVTTGVALVKESSVNEGSLLPHVLPRTV